MSRRSKAGALTAGLALVATPAVAAPGDPATLTVENSTFTAGSWGDGVDFVVTDIPAEATGVTVMLDSKGPNGGGLIAEPVEGVPAEDGTFSGNILPTQSSPVAPDASGFPRYTVSAFYTYQDANGDTQNVDAEPVNLTILPGLSVTGPAEATVAELAAGVELQFAGFQPDEQITGLIERYNPDTNAWEEIGDFSALLGPDGSGEGVLTITGASVGDTFRVSATGEDGTVYHFVNTVAEAGEQPGGEQPGGETPGAEQPGGETPAATPQAPRAPERVDTGA
ncbi:hypothetical protein EHW97_02375 [Aeromicrobium camelliae]|uniref:Uncharacterized protein n=1 Tax=Aeromicrobium camelliae TaxID=1538144 RepID=A0A3N6X7V2_9ACTN|nr:hypothetical protein [Aeromicrobium camelliae]RQN09708.1 hypothetical protein EHW97_02375 [Aeromicrobium camelliae]